MSSFFYFTAILPSLFYSLVCFVVLDRLVSSEPGIGGKTILNAFLQILSGVILCQLIHFVFFAIRKDNTPGRGYFNVFTHDETVIPGPWTLVFIFLVSLVLPLLYCLFRTIAHRIQNRDEYYGNFFGTWLSAFKEFAIVLSIIFVFVFGFDIAVNMILREREADLLKLIDNVFDWLYFNSITTLDFHKGFNFALVVSILIAVFFFLQLWSNPRAKGYVLIRYFILTLILSIGCFISSYALVNFIYNINSFKTFRSWYTEENSAGVLTLRVSSFVILFGICKYVLNHVFNRAIVLESGMRFKKYDGLGRFGIMSYSSYSSIYFSQIGFYILTLCVLFYSISEHHRSMPVNLLNWGLFFIIDDWAIIYNYIYKTGKIMGYHRFRIVVFNIVLVLLSLIILFELREYWFSAIYVLVIIFLLEMRVNNIFKVQVI